MRPFTQRERSLGNWLLALMFTLAAIAVAPMAFGLLRTEGLSLRSIIWLLAMSGFVSLIWRTVRAATRKTEGA